MLAQYLLIVTLGLYLLLALAMFVFKPYRSGLLTGFSIICWLILLPVGMLSQFSLYNNPVEVGLINYSSRKGHLYFFKSADCGSSIQYDFAVNANEESSLEVEGDQGAFGTIIFATENGQLFTFPFEEEHYRQLAIWEKELQPADSCYQATIEAYRGRQFRFAMAIGLLILGTTFIVGRRSRK